MRFRSDEEVLQECEELGEGAVEAKLKTGYFEDNPTPAHEWLLHRQRESDNRRMQQELRNTRYALIASWVLVIISIVAAIWQKEESQKQREIMKEQLEQQRKDSQAQRDDSKALLAVQISIEMDKQFDSAEMRNARKRLATELLNNKRVTEFRVLDFFETLAMYTSQGRIDKNTVYQSYSYWVERYFPAMKTFIEDTRRQEKDHSFYEGLEELCSEMLIDDKKAGLDAPSKKEILRFLKEESELSK